MDNLFNLAHMAFSHAYADPSEEEEMATNKNMCIN